MSDDIGYTGALGNLDIILPEAFIPYEDHVYLGRGKYASMYGVLSYPGYAYVGFFDEIIQDMRDKVQVMTHFSKIKSSKAIEALSDQIRVMGSNMRLHTSDDDAAMKQKIYDYQEIRERIQLNQEVLMQSVRIYKVLGNSKEELDENCEKFENICDNMQIIKKCLILDQEEAFKSTLPTMYMGFNESKFKKNIDTGGFVSLFAKGKSSLTHKNGTYLGKIADTGAPIVFDNFVGPPYLSNPMMLIFGIPGAGKSVAMKIIGKRANATTGDEIIYFDVEKESRTMIDDSGGVYINLDPGKKSGINPLDLVVSEEDGDRFVDVAGKIASIKSLLNVVVTLFRGSNLKGTEITALEFTLRRMYSEIGVNDSPESLYEQRDSDQKGDEKVFNVRSVKKKIFRLRELKSELKKNEATAELAEIMEVITGEGSMSMFDCYADTDIKMNHNMVGIGYKKIRDKKAKVFALITMIDWVWNKFSDYQYKDIRKRLLIDEGWDLIKHPEILEYLEEIDRKGRKYWAQLIITTHFVDDLLSTKEGKAILKLSATKVIMQQNIDSVDDISGYFSLPEDLRTELPMFEPGDAILIAGNEKVRMNFEVFEYEKRYVFT